MVESPRCASAPSWSQKPDVWTLLLDEKGQQLVNTVLPFGSQLPPPAARERVARVLATGKPLVTDLILGPATGKLLITIYHPARLADGRSFVVAQAVIAVLLDIGLPDIDGYEVARRLRANPATQDVPLIALTEYGQLRDKEAAARAGFDTHLVKPVDAATVLKAVEDVLARAVALED